MIARLVNTADAIRRAPEMSQSLSIRATEEACVYLKHPLIAGEQEAQLPEILKSSFCGRFSGSWQDTSSDAGAVWEIIARTLKFTGAKARLGPTDK